jgi:hypothetical protein
MIIKKFKNGNINVKFEKNYDNISESLLFHLLESSSLDFEIAISIDGFEMMDYCVGNFETATDLFSFNNQKTYTIMGKDTIDFMVGKTVKLIAYDDICKQKIGYDNN